VTPDPIAHRLLAGPPVPGPAEGLIEHVERLGELPPVGDGHAVITALERSGLLGRGGAGFPVGRKWRVMAERRNGRAVVVANGAEGEPASFKDRVLMASRPHLVIDGAALAAEAIGAEEIVLYVGIEHEVATLAMQRAVEVRRAGLRIPVRVERAPEGYVAGEATAAVHFINSGDARPTTTPPRVSQSGVRGQPTLVQNVESLAYAALIARFGDDWYRSAGRSATPGTGLITVTGAVREQGVREIELGTPVGEIVAAAGGRADGIAAVALGGYFGTWAPLAEAWDLPMDPLEMAAAGLTFGCGIVGVLPADACGIAATAEIMRFMATASAGQCGPCRFGLRALAEAVTRVAEGRASGDDLERIDRLAVQTAGRGACHHPDGAVQLLASARRVFSNEFRFHARTGHCPVAGVPAAVG
jgi:NADH:ubiquinone oxidoreductase subunit F (NADH-binding)